MTPNAHFLHLLPPRIEPDFHFIVLKFRPFVVILVTDFLQRKITLVGFLTSISQTDPHLPFSKYDFPADKTKHVKEEVCCPAGQSRLSILVNNSGILAMIYEY